MDNNRDLDRLIEKLRHENDQIHNSYMNKYIQAPNG